MKAKDQKKKSQRTPVKAKAIEKPRKNFFSANNRLGVIIILIIFTLAGLYMAINSGGSSVSFGQTGNDLGLSLNYDWINNGSSYSQTGEFERKIVIKSSNPVGYWRVISSEHYGVDKDGNPRRCADSSGFISNNRHQLAGELEKDRHLFGTVDPHTLEYKIRPGDEGKVYCFRGTTYPPGFGVDENLDGIDQIVRSYITSRVIDQSAIGLTVAQDGYFVTAEADREVYQWQALKSSQWATNSATNQKVNQCGPAAFGNERGRKISGYTGASAPQLGNPPQSNSTETRFRIALRDHNQTYCIRALSHFGNYSYATSPKIIANRDDLEPKMGDYTLDSVEGGEMTVSLNASRHPGVKGWKIIAVDDKSECTSANFTPSKIVLETTVAAQSVTASYKASTNYCFWAERDTDDIIFGLFYVSAQNIKNLASQNTAGDLNITNIELTTLGSLDILRATTNRVITSGSALRSDHFTGECSAGAFTSTNAAQLRSRNGNPFYITVTAADNDKSFCFKVTETRNNQTYNAFRNSGVVDLDNPDSGSPTPTSTLPPSNWSDLSRQDKLDFWNNLSNQDKTTLWGNLDLAGKVNLNPNNCASNSISDVIGRCIERSPVVPRCPDGTRLDTSNNQCVSSVIQCPGEQILFDGVCVVPLPECPDGQSLDAENVCVEDECPAGQSFNDDGDCEEDAYECPGGMILNSKDVCVVDKSAKCLDDEVLNADNECVKDSNCSDGESLNQDGVCAPVAKNDDTEEGAFYTSPTFLLSLAVIAGVIGIGAVVIIIVSMNQKPKF